MKARVLGRLAWILQRTVSSSLYVGYPHLPCIRQIITVLIETMLASKRWVLTRDQATKILPHYPDIPALGCPYGWGNVTWPNLGLQYKRYSSMAGDITMVAPRRMLATLMSKSVENVYSYRWDVPAFNTSTTIGVQHFAEV